MSGWNAKSRADMRAMAEALASVSGTHADFIAANILGRGLMRPQWWARGLAAFGAWRSGIPRNVFWAHMMQRFPGLAAQTIENTCEWIVNGKDADGIGAGGFNQREVDQLSGWLGLEGVAQ